MVYDFCFVSSMCLWFSLRFMIYDVLLFRVMFVYDLCFVIYEFSRYDLWLMMYDHMNYCNVVNSNDSDQTPTWRFQTPRGCFKRPHECKSYNPFWNTTGHGKGPIDGMFGRCAALRCQAAVKTALFTPQQYVDALRTEYTISRMSQDYSCKFILFQPPPKATLPQRKLDSKELARAEMSLRATTCFSSRQVLGGRRIRIVGKHA